MTYEEFWKAMNAHCKWTYSEDDGFWETGCGRTWAFTEGGLKENHVLFCHSCGGAVHAEQQPLVR